MSTLADLLMNAPPATQLDTGERELAIRRGVCQLLPDTPVIVINEIAQYFWGTFWRDVGALENSDFPSVAPPFPCFWMEYRVPKDALERVRWEFHGQRLGLYWLGVERIGGGDGWSLISLMFSEENEGVAGPTFSARVDVDAQGNVLGLLYDTFIPDEVPLSEQEREYLRVNMMTLHYPALLAICFMHCSNVQLSDHPPKGGHSRRHQKLFGRAPIVYKTLDIQPMQRMIKSQAGPSPRLKRALHIMRGHFKRFDEKPLFGKHKGLWWWSSYLRGALEHGYVKKSYEVHSPKGNDSDK